MTNKFHAFLNSTRFTGLLATASLLWLLNGCDKINQKPAAAGPPEVLVADIVRQDVPITRDWVAALDGSTNVDIRARVQGYLVKQNYNNGAFVKAGEVLF